MSIEKIKTATVYGKEVHYNAEDIHYKTIEEYIEAVVGKAIDEIEDTFPNFVRDSFIGLKSLCQSKAHSQSEVSRYKYEGDIFNYEEDGFYGFDFKASMLIQAESWRKANGEEDLKKRSQLIRKIKPEVSEVYALALEEVHDWVNIYYEPCVFEPTFNKDEFYAEFDLGNYTFLQVRGSILKDSAVFVEVEIQKNLDERIKFDLWEVANIKLES